MDFAVSNQNSTKSFALWVLSVTAKKCFEESERRKKREKRESEGCFTKNRTDKKNEMKVNQTEESDFHFGSLLSFLYSINWIGLDWIAHKMFCSMKCID